MPAMPISCASRRTAPPANSVGRSAWQTSGLESATRPKERETGTEPARDAGPILAAANGLGVYLGKEILQLEAA
jgi:hypothetical protein